jgi:thymidylate kinase
MRPVAAALKKAVEDGTDRIEAEGIDFHTRVQEAFLHIAEQEPQRVRVIWNDFITKDTAAQVFDAVRDLFTAADDASFEITDELLLRIKEARHHEGC